MWGLINRGNPLHSLPAQFSVSLHSRAWWTRSATKKKRVGRKMSASHFKQVMLDAHNDIRTQCSASNPQFTWSDKLAKYAQSYAHELVDRNHCKLSHSFNGHNSYKQQNAGENLAMRRTSPKTPDVIQSARMAVNAWAGEGSSGGHYTAMNWKSTRKLGCGYAQKDNCMVTVCNYAENAPNIRGKFDENVLCDRPLHL